MAVNIENLKERYLKIPVSNNNNRGPVLGSLLDVNAYLAHYNTQVKTTKSHGSSTLYVLDRCLFDENHSHGQAAIGQTFDGKLFYQCFHESCKGHTWKEARQKISSEESLKPFMVGLEPKTSSSEGLNSLNSLNSLNIDDVKAWPILNSKALFGLAGQVVDAATRYSEADPAAVLVTFLTRFATEVGSTPVIMVGDSMQYVRINTVIVGNSSKSRKGTSAKPIDRVFAHQGYGYRPARTSPGPLSSGEGLIYAVRDNLMEWGIIDKKTSERGWVEVDPGVADKRLCVIDEEFGSALSCTKRDGNTLSTIIRQAWDHGTIEPLTKTNRIKSTGAHICIISHITIFELQHKMHENEALNGFANRFLWVCARRHGVISRPKPMPRPEVDHLHEMIIHAVDKANTFQFMEFSDDTWAIWDKVYPELSKDHSGLAGVVINRAEVQVIRLAMIYALLDEQNIIMPHHLEAALALWDYCKESTLFIFGSTEGDVIADKIIEALHEHDLSSTDIHALFQRNIPAKKINNTVKDLLSRGKVTMYKEKKTKGKGKPITMYTLEKGATCNESNECNTTEEVLTTLDNEKNEFNEFNPSEEDFTASDKGDNQKIELDDNPRDIEFYKNDILDLPLYVDFLERYDDLE